MLKTGESSMSTPELNYQGMSIPQLEDLMLDASEEQEDLIVQELVKRGAPTKQCLECQEPIGHGLWCEKHIGKVLLSRNRMR